MLFAMRQLGLLVFLLLCACNKPQSNLAKLADNAVILAFGDSLTYGTGASSLHDYPHVLAELSHREVINEGVPGEITAEAINRLPDLLDQYQPNLLILIHGGNDFLKKIPKRITENNIDSMIAEAQNRGIPVFMLGVPEPGLLGLKSSSLYHVIAEKRGIPLDINALPLILGDSRLKSDLVHPNDEGYRLLATTIYASLQMAGAL